MQQCILYFVLLRRKCTGSLSACPPGGEISVHYLVDKILQCGRQGIALRGHKDDGPLSFNMPEVNDGNFRALLYLAIESGDSALNDHLKTANANATYVSKNIQNQMINAAGALIYASNR